MRGWGTLLGMVLVSCGSVSAERTEGTRFAIMGHLYPFAEDPSKLRAFLDAVLEDKPDLVFVLGDSSLENPEVVKAFRKTFRDRVYFSPGNHELKPETRRRYLQNVGYLEHTVSRPDAHFVLFNSSDSIERIVSLLSVVLDKLEDDRTTILMTHHRVWDDTLLSEGPYEHDKSFYFSRLYPVLQERVRFVFAGNSRRQFFRDVKTSKSFGNQNLNAVYWADQVGAITAYSVGMGDGFPKATYVMARVVDGEILMTPRTIAWDGRELVDPALLQPMERSRPPREAGAR